MFNRLERELKAREQSLGLRMSDLITLPEPLSLLLGWMIRKKQVTLLEIIEFMEKDEAAAKSLLAEALNRGYVRDIEMRGAVSYRVRMAPKRMRGKNSSLWDALGTKIDESGNSFDISAFHLAGLRKTRLDEAEQEVPGEPGKSPP